MSGKNEDTQGKNEDPGQDEDDPFNPSPTAGSDDSDKSTEESTDKSG